MGPITANELATARVATPAAAISWVSRIVIFASACIVIGIVWDISWHRTIGRDTFWTPAHMAIYLGGTLGGLTAGWLVIRTTWLGTAAERAGAVRLWGMYAPMGAWVSIWGAVAMLTSAPFDNWWHDAYGLDVKIISPPHSILAAGMWSVVGGALLLVLREQNLKGDSRLNPTGNPSLDLSPALFIFGAGVLLAMASVFLTETSFPNHQHSSRFYTWSASTYPIYLLGVARASRWRWASTGIALVYMAIMAGMTWVLPLFPGEPRLGPVYNRVEHFVPLPFPLLLVVPALAIDVVRNAIGHGKGWRRDFVVVVACAAAFVVCFGVTQWFFSGVMLSPHGENWLLAADRHWGYGERPDRWRYEYWNAMHGMEILRGLAHAFVNAIVSGAVGLWLGNWMARVRR